MIRNLTPHAIVIRSAEGVETTLPPSGTVARVATKSVASPTVEGIPTVRTEFGAVEGLPAPEQGTTYVVSALVLGRVPEREDVFAPDTGPTAHRDAAGKIVAVRGLTR